MSNQPNQPDQPNPSEHASPTKQHTTFPAGQINSGALEVVHRLHQAGYEAYIVGGCVRDLLLDLKPKDFDVATSATPEEIKTLFRSCRLIGRRFRLAHVRFGRDIIEVATFRAHYADTSPDDLSSPRPNNSATTNMHGMVLRDNVYGTIEEDAIRRDFTINALYYDPEAQEIIDHTRRGLNDMKEKRLCLIGDPITRYREDPVRMLRAARFSAKLGFEIEAESLAPIQPLSGLLNNIPAARLFDEVLKLFQNGHALETYQSLQHYKLFKWLFPQTSRALKASPQFEEMIKIALTNTDNRVRQGKPVTPAFLYAVMLWQPLCTTHKQLLSNKAPFFPMLQRACQQVIVEQSQSTSIPKRFTLAMRDIWDLQYRLDKRAGKRAARLIEHPRFRAAYDFLLLREASGEIEPGLGAWWTRYQDVDSREQAKMADSVAMPENKKRRRRRKTNRPTAEKPNDS